MFTARDMMTTPAITVTPKTTLEEASRLLLEYNISGMPVVNAKGKLAGMFSELDEARQLKEAIVVCSGLPVLDNDGTTVGHLSEADELSALVADFPDHTVSFYMTTDVVSVTTDDCITDIIDRFVSGKVHRLPVLHQGNVVGVIGVRDVVRFVRKIKQTLPIPATSSVGA